MSFSVLAGIHRQAMQGGAGPGHGHRCRGREDQEYEQRGIHSHNQFRTPPDETIIPLGSGKETEIQFRDL